MRSFKLDDLLSSRIFLGLLSILLSLALWLYVVGNRNEAIVREYESRLEFLNPPTDLALIPAERSAVVTLSGERRAMDAVRNESVVSEVDLKGLEAGRHSVAVRVRDIPRITMVRVVPRDVEVTLVRLVDKELSVKVLPPLDMPDGYIMDGAAVVPETVTAHGREDQLESMTEINVRPTMTELYSGGSWKIPLKAPEGMSVDFAPSDVTVSATYYQGIPRRELSVSVRTTGRLRAGRELVSLTPDPATVTVEGSLEAFLGVDSLPTDSVNLSRVKESGQVQTRIAALPEGLSLISSPVVSVNVEIRTQTETRTFTRLPIAVRNAEKGFEWIVEPASGSAAVDGTTEVLSGLTAKTLGLALYVDVSSIVADSIRLPVRVASTPMEGVEAISPSPAVVQLTRRAVPATETTRGTTKATSGKKPETKNNTKSTSTRKTTSSKTSSKSATKSSKK